MTTLTQIKVIMQDSNSPLQALAAIFAAHQPKSVLLCGASASSPMTLEIDRHIENVNTLDKAQAQQLNIPAERFDLVIVADLLENLSKAEGIRLLGRLKNAHSNRLCVFCNKTSADTSWADADFYGLGLHSNGLFEAQQGDVWLYTYDLAAYNHTRDWNNARFWANPGNFGRYWW